MADIKISELGAASAVNNTDLFPMTSAGVTVKATAQQIKNYIGVGNIADLNTTDKSSAVAAINEVNTKVSKTEVLIAYVQTSLTASKTYVVGEQFIYNGLLYKATATIAQGGTITINGNCTLADSVTKQIKTLSDDTGDVVLTTGISYRKFGNEVIVNFNGTNTTNLPNANWTKVGTLPIGCRPTDSICAVVGLSNGLNYYGFARIDGDGEIFIFHRVGSTESHIWGEVVFMI